MKLSMGLEYLGGLADRIDVEIHTDPNLRTPSQWQISGFITRSTAVWWLPGSATTHAFVEPGFFALIAARNLADAYRPDLPELIR